MLLVVLASAAGSVKPFDKRQSTWSLKPSTARTPGTLPQPEGARMGWWDSLWTGLLYLTVILVVLLAVRFAYLLVRTRQPKEPREDVEPSPGATELLTEAVDKGFAVVDRGTPSDAVIACWVALEDAAAAAGVARNPSETAAEFTVRVLAVDGVSAPDLATLGDLYREARYSTHPSSEETRTAARNALTRLRDDLAVKSSSRSFWRR